MDNLCGNCKYFDEHKKFVNESYLCSYLYITVKPLNYGCYNIQNSKLKKIKYTI